MTEKSQRKRWTGAPPASCVHKGVESVISVICCYNQFPEYAHLLASLNRQDTAFEMVAVDNTGRKFSCAADALNWGAQRAAGDILVFLHQDVRFLRPDSLRKLTAALRLCENRPCIVGPYGAARCQRGTVAGCIVQESLDECCIAMTKSTWEKFPFDAALCDGWHLYAVELCIRVRQAGGLILSGDFGMEHTSTGTVDKAYMATFKELLKRYKDEKWICTTCKSMPTNLLYFHPYYVLWKIKKCLLGNYNLSYKIKSLLKRRN